MRAITLSNGNITVNLDQWGQVRDFYYPYVGLENHVLGHVHRIGVWIDGNFWWLANNPSWHCNCHFQKQTMVGETVYTNREINVSISFIDCVDTNKNIFLRKIVIKNNSDNKKEVRVFFGQEFLISEHRLANTAFYDPTNEAVIHYKGRRVFLINGVDDIGHMGVSDYTVGVWGYDGKEGSFGDACDGELAKNSVEHGPTDSVVGMYTTVERDETKVLHYFIAVGDSIEEVEKLNKRVFRTTPEQLIEVSSNFWNAWVNKRKIDFYDLSEPLIDLYKRSLLIARSHFDNRGGVIASSDSDRLSYGKEGYTFVWPRDGALAVMALDNAGYTEVTKPFFQFMSEVMTSEGYLHHKYLPDKSLGSTWHSSVKQKNWLRKNNLQLPIQEDETASVIFALWNHYKKSYNIEMVEKYYEEMIYPAGQFMINYRDEKTGLPLESYDLWEEKLGVATYTVASVYGGLMACSRFAQLLGKRKHYNLYQDVALSIKGSMIKYLFSKTRNAFIRTVYFKEDGSLKYEEIIDSSSLYGLWLYGVLDTSDPLFQATHKAVLDNLKNTCPMGGVIRYENDEYYRHTDKSNPWFICTLWEIQLKIKLAKTKSDLEIAKNDLSWILKHTTASGILAEQIHAYTGEPICVSPLTWSHSTYIDTILMYIKKAESLKDK